MTRLTRLALGEPGVTILAMLLLFGAGTAAALSLNQELIPDIEFPQASVVAVWPGASADQVTRQVVEPIEAALEELEGIEVIEVSSRASEAFAAVTVRAEYGTTQDELRTAIQDALADLELPDGVSEPETVLFDFSDLPVVSVSASADMALEELQRLIEDEVVPDLEAIEGVSRVTVVGGVEDKVFVTLDPEKMAARGVTVESIRRALAANNVSLPAGTLMTNGQAIPLRVGHRLTAITDLEQLVLQGSSGGFGGPAGGAPSGGAPAAAVAPPPAGAGAEAPTAEAVSQAPPAGTPTPVHGPYPLPPMLQALGFLTTDDLDPALIRDLAESDPDFLRAVAREVINSLPPGSLDELPSGVVDALPEDIRAELIARTGPSPTATLAGPPAPTAVAAPVPLRVRVVVVRPGDTLEGIAARFGVDPAVIREANELATEELPVGTVLRVPLPAEGDLLPPAWQSLGVRRAGQVTPTILEQAIDQIPEAVSDLTADQLLALPPQTVARLPEPLLARQGPEVEAQLRRRIAEAALATAVPSPTPTSLPTVTPAAAPAGARGPVGQGLVTLGDVATVELAPQERDTINRTNGEPSLSLLVAKEQSANTVKVANQVLDLIEGELADRQALADVSFNTIFEQASFIEESLRGVGREGVLGAVFAVLAILIFLSFSVRSTLVTTISIPLSVFIGFLLMRLQGLTLNLLTLSGMTVAIGRVVDDSIVVLENIYRHIQRGERRLDAVLEGAREVATAITASTLVTVAVFLPLGFMGGIISQFFLPFGLTVTYALLASLLVAVTIVPVLARIFLSRGVLPEERETWLQRIYTPILEWALDHRLVTLLAALVVFFGSLALVRFIPRTFLPTFGEPSVSVELALDPGTALDTTDAVARQIEQALMDDPDVDTVQATIGSSGAAEAFFLGAVGGNTARAEFFASLDEDRQAEPDAIADRIRRQLEALEVGVPYTVTVSVGGVGGHRGNIYDLQIRSADEEALRQANALVLAALKDPSNWEEDYDQVPIVNLSSNLTEARDVLAVDVDPARAAERGLSAVQVGLALRQVLEGEELGEVELVGESQAAGADGSPWPPGMVFTVQARFPEDLIDSVEALKAYEVSGPLGPVRLDEVATIELRPGPVVITRIDGERAAVITGEIADENTFGVIADAERIIDDLGLDEEVVEVGAGVETSSQQRGFRDMLVALPVSIAVVYLIMAVTFGSLVHPFTILFSLPFAVTGALAALAITGRPISVSSLIGMLMLVGIVVTNAIVLVDLVQQYRARGMDARTALVRGGRTRLRPILMTAVATVLALIPMSLGFTEGAIVAAELATVVIGGLTTSTLLTLLVVPVMYSLLDPLSSTGRRPVPQPAPIPPGGGQPPPIPQVPPAPQPPRPPVPPPPGQPGAPVAEP